MAHDEVVGENVVCNASPGGAKEWVDDEVMGTVRDNIVSRGAKRRLSRTIVTPQTHIDFDAKPLTWPLP